MRKKNFALAVLLFVCLSSLPTCGSIAWIAIGKEPADTQPAPTQKSAQFTILSPLSSSTDNYQLWNSSASCNRKRTVGFTREQRLICQQNLDLMSAVVQAAKLTIDVCQELFADRRWNCSSITRAPKFLPDLTGGSREQAFVYSLAASSLALAVAKACSSGQSTKCGCAQEPFEHAPGNFKWGGCGDDVKFGVSFGKQFSESLDSKRRKRSKDYQMNLHNEAVGRKILSDSVKTVCKCHGVSGSCSVKTCFKSLPALKTVGTLLQNRYSGAVEFSKDSGDVVNGPPNSLIATSKKSGRSFSKRLAGSDRLIFSAISPDYCHPDPDLGSIGTKGRECDKESAGSSGCRSMCCGRGFTSEMVEQTYRCECRYYWCCYVKCKTCKRLIQVHRCR